MLTWHVMKGGFLIGMWLGNLYLLRSGFTVPFPPAACFRRNDSAGKAFVAMDRILDGARHGPAYLGRPEIAELVANALFAGECKVRRYELHAFVEMPNHVHMLVTPSVPSTKWLGPLNQVLHDLEFARIRDYIELNPVKAGLVDSVEKFRWSSAWGIEPPQRRLQPGLAAPL